MTIKTTSQDGVAAGPGKCQSRCSMEEFGTYQKMFIKSQEEDKGKFHMYNQASPKSFSFCESSPRGNCYLVRLLGDNAIL